MDKRSVLLVFSGYVIWGLQPLYWSSLAHMDSMFILGFRILWAVVFTVGILAVTKRLKELKSILFNWQKMKFLIPAALFLLLDWGVFIVAVQTGHVLDTSLGYYIAPFVVFGIGIIIFKERPTKTVLIGMLMALLGVLFNIIYNVVKYGKFPILSILLSLLFAIYGMLKKYAQVDSVVSIAAETLLMAPLAILFLLLFQRDAIASCTASDHLLLIGAGVITALPMILYSLGILKLPFIMLGFMQYISPTLSLISGLFLGEALTIDKTVTFLFIWAGLTIYLTALLRAEKAKLPPAKER